MTEQVSAKENFIRKTSIPGVLLIERPVHPDSRGFFHEIVRLNLLIEASGVEFKPVQMSHAMCLPGVIKAFHTEKLNKLGYPVTGKCFSAIVDVRPDSPMFGKYEIFEFDNESENSPHAAIFIPAGVGNSVCVSGNEPVHYIYEMDKYWLKENEQGIAWDDPDLAVPWPVKNPIISDRDRNNPTLRVAFPDMFKK